MTTPVIAFVGLGGNLGDPEATLGDALQALDGVQDTRLLRASRLYRTPAWGVTAQPDFINAVALVETALASPIEGRCSTSRPGTGSTGRHIACPRNRSRSCR